METKKSRQQFCTETESDIRITRSRSSRERVLKIYTESETECISKGAGYPWLHALSPSV